MRHEQIHVSVRFRLSVESTIRQLLANAAHDEGLIPQLTDFDHRRRQTLLVKRQLEKAFRLIELLGVLSHRPQQAA